MNAKIFGEIDSIYFDLHSESINCKYNRIFIFTSLGATKDTLVKLNSLFYAGCNFEDKSSLIFLNDQDQYNIIPVANDSILLLNLGVDLKQVKFTVQENPFDNKLFKMINTNEDFLKEVEIVDSLNIQLKIVASETIVVKYFLNSNEVEKRYFDLNEFVKAPP